jgi:hypothetical protein
MTTERSVPQLTQPSLASQSLVWSVCILPAAALCACASQPQQKPAQVKWISLFNGMDLTGWTPKIRGYELGDNWGNTFRVENGVLKVAYDKYEAFDNKFGHLFCKTPFSHYRMRLEYRFTGDQTPGGPGWALRNSGIMIHCQDPKTMGKDQDFPVCIEVQLLGGDGQNERTTGNLCTPGTNVVMSDKLVTQHCVSSKSETYHGDRWVKAEIEVNGDGVIKHLINGRVVLEYQEPQLDPSDADAKKLLERGAAKMLSEGYISLQAESHPCAFRKIEILPLQP